VATKTDHANMTTIWSDPTFLWPTDIRSHNLEADCLSRAHDGIVEAAGLLLFDLDPRDVSWLEAHGGRFQQSCLGPTSNKHKTVSRGKRFADLAVGSPAAEEAIAAHALRLHSSTVGASVRFSSTVGSSNHVESMEQRLRGFCIVGDHQSMLILLPHSPFGCCSVSRTLLQACVRHKFGLGRQHLCQKFDNGDELVKDRFDRQVMGESSAKNKDGFDCLSAALSCLHALGKVQEHSDSGCVLQCQGCHQQFLAGGRSQDRFPPCFPHKNQPTQFCCMGNPTVAWATQLSVLSTRR
jgi:hypothetical protein